MDDKIESTLDSLYYGRENGHPGAFLSINGLCKAAKKKLPNLLQTQVAKWLNKQTVYVERKERSKKQLKGSKRYFLASKPKYELIIDSAYIQRYRSPQNFMILGVDLFSTRIYTSFIKKLTAANVARVKWKKWLNEGKSYKVVLTDNGSEYKGAFTSMLKERGIKHIYSSAKWANKTSIAEIYIRRWKEMLSKIIASKRETNPLKAFNLATQMLNSNTRTDTGLTPSEMEQNVQTAQYRKMYKRLQRQDVVGVPKPPRFKEKDKVYLRAKNDSKSFKSGDKIVDSPLYAVAEVTPTKPVASYKLKLFEFPYSVLDHTFDETQLISAKDL